MHCYHTAGYPNPNALPLRFLMHKKEAEYIIGEKCEVIKFIRNQSGAKIDISECIGMERIVTITGSICTIDIALTMICKVFQERLVTIPRMRDQLAITLNLILPHAICGLLIGRGGKNVQYMKKASGSLIRVSDNFLPNSSDKTVSIKGTSDNVTKGIHAVCEFLLQSPEVLSTMPYNPKSEFTSPVILAGNQTYIIRGKYAVPVHEQVLKEIFEKVRCDLNTV